MMQNQKYIFIIHELQNLESVRKGIYFFGTLTQAKRAATKSQVFCGTVLKITDDNGRTISTKTNKKWVDHEIFFEF
jgi:hypothetical protein